MTNARVKWYGNQLISQITSATPDALWAAAEELLETAQAKVKSESGDLVKSGYIATRDKSTYTKSSIHNREVKPRDDASVVVGFAAFYARFVEYGTKKAAARPFLRPTLDEKRSDLGLTAIQKMSKALR